MRRKQRSGNIQLGRPTVVPDSEIVNLAKEDLKIANADILVSHTKIEAMTTVLADYDAQIMKKDIKIQELEQQLVTHSEELTKALDGANSEILELTKTLEDFRLVEVEAEEETEDTVEKITEVEEETEIEESPEVEETIEAKEPEDIPDI